jgi:hypothetical protein
MNVECFMSIHSSVDGHTDCFHFGAIMNNTVLTICIQVFVFNCLMFKFGGTIQLFPLVAAPFYNPTNNV